MCGFYAAFIALTVLGPCGFLEGAIPAFSPKTSSTVMDSTKAAFSIPSIIAIIAAILSFFTGAILGMILAGIAIVMGLLGFVLSLSPRTRGGIISVLGIFAGVIGVIAAVVKAIMWVTG